MTQDSGDHETSESDASGGAQRAPKAQRRVAKTLLEAGSPELKKIRNLLQIHENEAKQGKKVAKTLIDVPLPQIEKPQSVRKVARTLLEADLPSIEQLQVDQVEVADQQTGAESVSRPKVARTLLEADLPAIEQLQVDQVEVADQQTGAESVSRPKVARTLLEADLPAIEQLQVDQVEVAGQKTETESVSKPKLESVERVQKFVAKTILDSDVLARALSNYQVRKTELAAEEARIRASQPGVEFHPVESNKLAQPCAWRWDDDTSTERFRYCANCKTQLYNFEGLELPEAEALIFTRENKRNATLYKRPDGKFMTQDCPVQVKRKRRFVLFSVVGATLVLVLLTALILMPPRALSPNPSDATTHVNEAEIGSRAKEQGGASSNAAKNGNIGVQQGASSTGKRERPTFTPRDEKLYWK